MAAGQNSGCEASGECGTSAGQNSSSGGMSYVARRRGDRMRVCRPPFWGAVIFFSRFLSCS